MKIDETAIIDIAVSGGGSSESGGTQQLTLTITSNDQALDSVTEATYSSSLASTFLAATDFTNSEAMSVNWASNPSSYESINLHKALAYGKYGDNKVVAVMDDWFSSGCTVSGLSYTHPDISGKSVSSYKDSGSASVQTYCAKETGIGAADSSHGDQIIGLIAGTYHGNYGIMGIAPLADLHISSYLQKGGQTYYADHWANATDSARSAGAVALNMSWGSNTVLADDIQNYMSNNSVDAATIQLHII